MWQNPGTMARAAGAVHRIPTGQPSTFTLRARLGEPRDFRAASVRTRGYGFGGIGALSSFRVIGCRDELRVGNGVSRPVGGTEGIGGTAGDQTEEVRIGPFETPPRTRRQ